MTSYEEQVRRELEKAAAEQQICPVGENVDAALGIGRTLKKAGVKVRQHLRKHGGSYVGTAIGSGVGMMAAGPVGAGVGAGLGSHFGSKFDRKKKKK